MDKIFSNENMDQIIPKLNQFIKITLALVLIQVGTIFMNKEDNFYNNKGSLIFCSILYILYFLFHYKILPYFREACSTESKKNLDLLKATQILNAYKSIFILCTLFSSTLFIINFFKEPFLQGLGISSIIGVMQYFNLVIIRNLRLSTFIEISYYIYIYFVSSKEYIPKLLLILFMLFTISFMTSFQVFQKFISVFETFSEKLQDIFNVYMQFIEDKSEAICIKSLKDESIFFLNNASKKLDFDPKKFSVSNSNIYNKSKRSLFYEINQILQKPFTQNEIFKELYEDTFSLDYSNGTSLFEVQVIKLKKRSNEYLGIFLKDITKTALSLHKASEEKVLNRQSCTISHELQTPINQALGLITNIKKSIKKEKQKTSICSLRSSLYKLSLKVDEFLELRKNLEGRLKPETNLAKLSKIFKEIYYLNFDRIYHKSPQFIFYIDPILVNVLLPFDSTKLVIVLQEIIEKILENSNTKFQSIFISASLLDEYIHFSIEGKIIFEENIGRGKRRAFNTCYSNVEVDRAEIRYNFTKELLPLIYNSLGISINEKKMYGKQIAYNIKLPINHNPGKTPNAFVKLRKRSELQYENIEEFSFLRPKRNHLKTTSKIKKLSSLKLLPFFSTDQKGSQSLINEQSLVLVVDDNPMNRFPLCEIIKSLNIKVEEAENGLLAFEKYKEIKKREENNKLLILMDLDMPIMDGITSCTNIREYEKENNYDLIPIIAVTAYDSELEKEKALKSGMNAFYKKPLKKDQLMEILKKFL